MNEAQLLRSSLSKNCNYNTFENNELRYCKVSDRRLNLRYRRKKINGRSGFAPKYLRHTETVPIKAKIYRSKLKY